MNTISRLITVFKQYNDLWEDRRGRLPQHCHVTLVRMRLAHVLSFGRDSPSVLMCSVLVGGYLGEMVMYFSLLFLNCIYL